MSKLEIVEEKREETCLVQNTYTANEHPEMFCSKRKEKQNTYSNHSLQCFEAVS